MKVTVAKSAGFCFGVKKAVDIVYDLADKEEGPIYTYGPIIHNENVVDDLKKKGVEIINTIEEARNIKNGIVVIRSHGITKSEYEGLKSAGHKVVDATCPFVKKIHDSVYEESKKGSHIIIIGDDKHPEVLGIKGWVCGKVSVISDEKDIDRLKLVEKERVFVVSQTTFNYNKFEYLVEKLKNLSYDIIVFNTICNATSVRQKEAIQIAEKVDAMIVIGGKHSSNTQKLYEICKSRCENTCYIQELVDLDLNELKSIGSVGITAGASTPNNIIKEVQTHVRKF